MDDNFIKRIPPHSVEAEQSVLGSMLIDKDAISNASEALRGDDFYRPDHGIIYDAMLELFQRNEPVDLVTLKTKLEERGKLNEVGGIQYLSNLAAAVPTSVHIKQYVKIVEDKATLRRLVKAGENISTMGYSGEDELDVIMSKAEEDIFNISQGRRSDDFTHIHDILIGTFDKIEAIANSNETVTGISTGFADLDYKTSGLQPSDMVLIAARPSMGKTAFALNVAQHAALRGGFSTAIFSLEMSKDQLVNRLLCAEAMVDAQKLRTGSLEDEDWVRIARAMGPLSEAPIYIDDTPGINIMDMRAKCRKLKLERGLDLILIDYLQLMTGAGKTESRQQEISEISRSLKALAREMSAPVVALSQLSRACESRADHRPMLSDLRESGAIEQDADVVMFLYRDEYYNPDTEAKNQGECIIAKQRNGPTGTVHLAWLGQYTKFANLSKEM